jgi:hypothetical protein
MNSKSFRQWTALKRQSNNFQFLLTSSFNPKNKTNRTCDARTSTINQILNFILHSWFWNNVPKAALTYFVSNSFRFVLHWSFFKCWKSSNVISRTPKTRTQPLNSPGINSKIRSFHLQTSIKLWARIPINKTRL